MSHFSFGDFPSDFRLRFVVSGRPHFAGHLRSVLPGLRRPHGFQPSGALFRVAPVLEIFPATLFVGLGAMTPGNHLVVMGFPELFHLVGPFSILPPMRFLIFRTVHGPFEAFAPLVLPELLCHRRLMIMLGRSKVVEVRQAVVEMVAVLVVDDVAFMEDEPRR